MLEISRIENYFQINRNISGNILIRNNMRKLYGLKHSLNNIIIVKS